MAKGFFGGGISKGPKPEGILPACGACGLLRKCSHPKLPYHGSGRAGILLVDAAPTEHGGGAMYTPHSTYRLVSNILDDHGLDMAIDCWSAGALSCTVGTRWPTGEEVGHCRPLFHDTVKALNPVLIIPFGYAATIACVRGAAPDVSSPQTWPGWRIPDQRYNAWICPTYHPGTIKDDGKYGDVLGVIVRDHVVSALGRRHQRPWPGGVPDWSGRVEVLYGEGEAAAAIRSIVREAGESGGAIAFDYEANMLKPDPDNSKIVCASMAWGNGSLRRCISFPWLPGTAEAMREFAVSSVPKIAQNAKFEGRWTRRHLGVRIRNWAWDTMNMGHLVDNREGVTGLKTMAYLELGQPDYDASVSPYLTANGTMVENRIAYADPYRVMLYCGMDSILTFLVALRQAKKLGHTPPWRV